MRARVAAGTAALALGGLLLSGCRADAPPAHRTLVVVSAPLTSEQWVGRFIERGARLAAASLPAVALEVLDNGGSAQTAVAIARRAVAERAAALVTDGVGALAVAGVTDPAHLPVLITFEGGARLVDPVHRPTLFRLAPADRYLSRRLADYLADVRRGAGVAVLSDDTDYGREGAATVTADLRHDDLAVPSVQSVPQHATGVGQQVLAARRSGATALVVWAHAPVLASVLREVRSTGWRVPVYSGPTAEDPLVRQQLADRPEWVEGLTFVSFRITSETGPAPFAGYRAAFERRYGVDRIGVRAGGKEVVMPPDWSTYSFDAVRLVAAAADRARVDRSDVLTALQQVSITGANGDERGFGPDDREGVSPDDMYFARFHDMRFVPTTDDVLSTQLPVVPQ